MLRETDLAKSVAEEFSLTNKEAAAIVNHVFESMKRSLIRGREVQIRNFFKMYTFKTVGRKLKICTTGEQVNNDEYERVSCSFVRQFRSMVKDNNKF